MNALYRHLSVIKILAMYNITFPPVSNAIARSNAYICRVWAAGERVHWYIQATSIYTIYHIYISEYYDRKKKGMYVHKYALWYTPKQAYTIEYISLMWWSHYNYINTTYLLKSKPMAAATSLHIAACLSTAHSSLPYTR